MWALDEPSKFCLLIKQKEYIDIENLKIGQGLMIDYNYLVLGYKKSKLIHILVL